MPAGIFGRPTTFAFWTDTKSASKDPKHHNVLAVKIASKPQWIYSSVYETCEKLTVRAAAFKLLAECSLHFPLYHIASAVVDRSIALISLVLHTSLSLVGSACCLCLPLRLTRVSSLL